MLHLHIYFLVASERVHHAASAAVALLSRPSVACLKDAANVSVDDGLPPTPLLLLLDPSHGALCLPFLSALSDAIKAFALYRPRAAFDSCCLVCCV